MKLRKKERTDCLISSCCPQVTWREASPSPLVRFSGCCSLALQKLQDLEVSRAPGWVLRATELECVLQSCREWAFLLSLGGTCPLDAKAVLLVPRISLPLSIASLYKRVGLHPWMRPSGRQYPVLPTPHLPSDAHKTSKDSFLSHCSLPYFSSSSSFLLVPLLHHPHHLVGGVN